MMASRDRRTEYIPIKGLTALICIWLVHELEVCANG